MLGNGLQFDLSTEDWQRGIRIFNYCLLYFIVIVSVLLLFFSLIASMLSFIATVKQVVSLMKISSYTYF